MAKVVNADIYKAIDAINKQIQAIVKAGEKGTINVNLVMNDYQNMLRAVIPDNLLLIDTPDTPRTYPIQISKSVEAQNTLQPQMLQRIKNLPTIGQYRQEAREAVARELGIPADQVTNEQIKQYTDDRETVRNAEDSRGKIHYNADDYAEMVQPGTKSYAELAEIVRRYEGQIQEQNNQLGQVATNYDRQHANAIRASATGRRAGAGDMVR